MSMRSTREFWLQVLNCDVDLVVRTKTPEGDLSRGLNRSSPLVEHNTPEGVLLQPLGHLSPGPLRIA